jgi:hypothetical protein
LAFMFPPYASDEVGSGASLGCALAPVGQQKVNVQS